MNNYRLLKKKSKALPLPPCRWQWGYEVQLLLILDLGTRSGWVVSVPAGTYGYYSAAKGQSIYKEEIANYTGHSAVRETRVF
jgi:hypothetical protein